MNTTQVAETIEESNVPAVASREQRPRLPAAVRIFLLHVAERAVALLLVAVACLAVVGYWPEVVRHDDQREPSVVGELAAQTWRIEMLAADVQRLRHQSEMRTAHQDEQTIAPEEWLAVKQQVTELAAQLAARSKQAEKQRVAFATQRQQVGAQVAQRTAGPTDSAAEVLPEAQQSTRSSPVQAEPADPTQSGKNNGKRVVRSVAPTLEPFAPPQTWRGPAEQPDGAARVISLPPNLGAASMKDSHH